jgi:hypothetical protein
MLRLHITPGRFKIQDVDREVQKKTDDLTRQFPFKKPEHPFKKVAVYGGTGTVISFPFRNFDTKFHQKVMGNSEGPLKKPSTRTNA